MLTLNALTGLVRNRGQVLRRCGQLLHCSGWSANDGSSFLIGDFSYRNGSVFSQSTNFTGIDLAVELLIDNPIGVMESFVFDFNVTNTPNTTGDPVLDGDIVTAFNPGSQSSFNYLGTEYALELLGFSSDAGMTTRTDFSSPEDQTASAGIYAQIVAVDGSGGGGGGGVNTVPEPSSFALLAISVIGMLRFSARKLGQK